MMKILLGCWVLLVLQAQLSSCVEGFQLAQSDECGKIEEIPGDPRTKAPWVAGIFARASSSKPFEFHVTGTVLDPHTILTVLGGVYGQPSGGRKYWIPSAQNHKIAVGLTSTDLKNADEQSQVVEVSYIIPYNGVDPENKQFHFFLFKLKSPLNLKTPYVRAACLPVFAKHLPSSPYGQGSDVVTGGFVSPNNDMAAKNKELKIIKAKLEDKSFCDEKFSAYYKSSADHIYCGRLAPEQSTECPSYGTAAVVPFYSSRWFIAGILALHPQTSDQSSWCTKSTVFYYGSLQKALDWILENLKCDGSEFSCGDKCISMNQMCDKNADCSDKRDEDPIYCRARKPCLSSSRPFECGVYGPCLKKEMTCDGKKDCPDGEDEAPQTCGIQPLAAFPSIQHSDPPRTQDTGKLRCPHLQKSEGVVISCKDENNQIISCDEAVPGTTARFECQRYYVSTGRLANAVMTCKDDGSWKPFRAFGCEAQCGILKNKAPEVQSYIVSGSATNKDEPYPWHAAIFAKRNKGYSFTCGGSLIEKNVVITAGHCLADSSGSQFPTHTLKVVLGGNSSVFEINERTAEAQIFDVKVTWVPATYDPRTLKSDIGLIQLDHEAKYGEYVRPVCYLPRGSNTVPPSGTHGMVPGYGYTAEKKISEYLQAASFPIISRQECLESLQKDPPLNTFCAGYKNGTSVCQGDSGGGMVFIDSGNGVERYVLRGLVSHGDRKVGQICDPFNYAVFTHVDAYADWIIPKIEASFDAKQRSPENF